MIAFFITLALTLMVAWVLLSPLLQSHEEVSHQSLSATRQGLEDQRERCIQVLKDLELDLATGKISEHDYEETRTRLSVELATILKGLDSDKTTAT